MAVGRAKPVWLETCPTPIIRLSGSGGALDRFSVLLHVVSKHHDHLAFIADIHQPGAIERTADNLNDGSLRNHDHYISAVTLGDSHSMTSQTKTLASFQFSLFSTLH